MIFGINTTSDISKLLYVISRAVRPVKFETILKYHEWYLCQISRTNHPIICLCHTRKRFVIFTCRYFKLSWNTTALSQSNCRNISCSGIRHVNQLDDRGWKRNCVTININPFDHYPPAHERLWPHHLQENELRERALPEKKWAHVCGKLPETLTLFQPKSAIFPTLFQTWSKIYLFYF